MASSFSSCTLKNWNSLLEGQLRAELWNLLYINYIHRVFLLFTDVLKINPAFHRHCISVPHFLHSFISE